MDIRSFFKRKADTDVAPRLIKKIQLSELDHDPESEGTPTTSSELEEPPTSRHPLDIICALKSSLADNDLKRKLLTSPWTPPDTYNFKADAAELNQARAFRPAWLSQYSWLAYSSVLKGALCRQCVVFKPVTGKGRQEAFIVTVFTKYKKFHESAKEHEKCEWHKDASERRDNFLRLLNKATDVALQLDTAAKEEAECNKQKLVSITAAVLFCGMHDLPLRGKQSQSGIFQDLLRFRVDAGDHALQEHLDNSAKNAKYTSASIQNELIKISEDLLRRDIVSACNKSGQYSLLADESADISGTEQLTIGIRFVDTDLKAIREEFVGMIPLESMDAETISATILKAVDDFGLNPDNIVGQGYDGCSSMAGNISGVQARIKEKHPRAMYFHCASHRLNLVVNKASTVADIRNTVASIKATIKFFRESPPQEEECAFAALAS
ncbi:hypothetical protein MTO96_022499 [Rhipicephalus appendiculatus]